mmetsp:Transcript_74836/g.173433  ORF Transcript_74836/g.173433 Transcript_74836/m.173433 type:complete len:325 (-) Transcript_74836:103-1077(-)|eukprot:CAMPEP_0171099272 /NCGR_PEP_ID=MMETSP0766_2-20121228/50994_1 /TAXON_ID=439317 /ORGANISM="Gambierdiscus australes, Strain CAWD 149" /LENGTH=324 /DNA_ID=CAMNT_0011558853 /DNA_START=54 /DNA_END=1028 /DNA_ORIENTATION=-
MGNSITVTPDTDSPTTPGQLCVLSEELPIAFDDMVDGVIEVLKDPAPVVQRSVLKATEVVDLSEKEFTVKVILDGQKLDVVGYGDGKGTDKVMIWMKVTHDPEDTVKAESYISNPETGDWLPDAKDAIVYSTSVSKILKDPVRIEYYMENNNKERLTGQPIADTITGYLSAILEMKKERKVKCTPELDSLKDAGKKSVISAPMDEFTTYDKLFDAMTDFAKEFPEADIQKVSENEVHITGPNGVETPAGSLDVFFDKETGELCRTHTIGGKVMDKNYGILHKEPLQLEAWLEKDGNRIAGKPHAKMMEIMLETKLDGLSSWSLF